MPFSFSKSLLDRSTSERKIPQWISGKLSDTSAIFVPVLDGKNFFSNKDPLTPRFLNGAEVPKGASFDTDTIFLGLHEDIPYFALIVTGDQLTAELEEVGHFADIKEAALHLGDLESEALLLAKAMVHWKLANNHCSRCGAANTPLDGGHLLRCTDAACATTHFPRTDPAVIVLVEFEGKALLGRHANWPVKMHSVIAGFVDPGETIEAAVLREVREETGVKVVDVNYVASQPWPFPTSLMMGFYAKAVSDDLNIDLDELDEARWFTREEVKRELAAGNLKLPGKLSISHWLIKGWYEAEGETLDDLIK